MTFLPVASRELRAATRRKGTYRVRWWTAFLAFAVSFFLAGFMSLAGGRRGQFGELLFITLTGYSFGLALFAGIFLTSSSLAEEKSQGTLGLLFLTDLKGYDVVLGKFFANSLNAFYGLLALLPMAGIPLLFGGITGAQFLRTSLALLNALFFSLAAGIASSSVARNAREALTGTFLLLLGLVAGLPFLARLSLVSGLAPYWGWPAWLSPFHAYSLAVSPVYVPNAGSFWGSLLTSNATGWLLLIFASRWLPAHWQPVVLASAARPRLRWLPFLGDHRAAGASTKRGGLLSSNPVHWLMGEQPDLRRAAWAIVGLWGVIVFAKSWQTPNQAQWAYQGAKMCGFVLKMLIAVQVCRFFVESRQDGSLELLLCTPMRNAEIIQGQWQALRRVFLWPVASFFLLNFVPVAFLISSTSPQGWDVVFGSGIGALANGWVAITFVMDVLAVGWFGMWVALSVKNPSLAPAWTILFVLVLPSFLCFFDLITDLIFMIWGITQLQQDMRWVLARQYHRAMAPPLHPAVSAPSSLPPVIAQRW